MAYENNLTNGNDRLEPPTVQEVRRFGTFRETSIRLGYEHALTDDEDGNVAEMVFTHETDSYREAVDDIDDEKWKDAMVEKMGAPARTERGN